MIPTIPLGVWEQISIVVVFALLLSGLGWVIVKVFVKAISDINQHYAALLSATNQQWQKYFDARMEASNLLYEKLAGRMDEIARILGALVKDFEDHDVMERTALDTMEVIKFRPKK